MLSFGYTLSSEEHAPKELVARGASAEQAGFDFLTISDHYHPWVTEQGHSGFVWSVLGALAAETERIDVAVGVTCPIIRIHPAIIAQAAATTSLLMDGRFTLGVGTGEALNEHILGHRWPRPEVRRMMLVEAVEIIRELWSGETVDRRGDFYEVENARLFDPPTSPPPIVVSGFGPEAVDLAATIGDGFWGHGPDPEQIQQFRRAGGKGPRYAQVNVCWAEDEAEARATAYRVWPNAGVAGQLSQDLPTWTHFEQAVETVREEDATKAVSCGPDVGPYVEAISQYAEAGFDHLHLHQIGPDQEGFLRFWQEHLHPAVAHLGQRPAA
jgi:G6PDH family F420-dependent oxidoreductase